MEDHEPGSAGHPTVARGEQRHGHAIDQLIPIVYDELRRLAARYRETPVDGQAAEVSQLDDAALALVDCGEPGQRFVQREHLLARAGGEGEHVLERLRARSRPPITVVANRQEELKQHMPTR